MRTTSLPFALFALATAFVVGCATSAASPPRVEYKAEPAGSQRLAPYEGMVLLYGYEGGEPGAECAEVGRVEAPADEAGNLPALALRKAAQSLGGNGVKDIERDPTSRGGRIWFTGTALRCP